MSTLSRRVVLAAPGVSLAVVGATHPPRLTYDSAQHWWLMHLAGVFVFPLVGAALAALVWGRRDPLAWVVYAGSFVYACAYTSLDVISGLAAGWVTDRLGPGVERPDEVRYLFEIGGRLGDAGELGLMFAVAALSVDAVRRVGPVALPGAVMLVLGGWGVVVDHIFWPWGALGAGLLGLGSALLDDPRLRRPVP